MTKILNTTAKHVYGTKNLMKNILNVSLLNIHWLWKSDSDFELPGILRWQSTLFCIMSCMEQKTSSQYWLRTWLQAWVHGGQKHGFGVRLNCKSDSISSLAV